MVAFIQVLQGVALPSGFPADSATPVGVVVQRDTLLKAEVNIPGDRILVGIQDPGKIAGNRIQRVGDALNRVLALDHARNRVAQKTVHNGWPLGVTCRCPCTSKKTSHQQQIAGKHSSSLLLKSHRDKLLCCT